MRPTSADLGLTLFDEDIAVFEGLVGLSPSVAMMKASDGGARWPAAAGPASETILPPLKSTVTCCLPTEFGRVLSPLPQYFEGFFGLGWFGKLLQITPNRYQWMPNMKWCEIPKLNQLLRIHQAAEYLGVCLNTLRNWCRQGKVPEYRHSDNPGELCRHQASIVKP